MWAEYYLKQIPPFTAAMIGRFTEKLSRVGARGDLIRILINVYNYIYNYLFVGSGYVFALM
jgi:hypothetical protein